MKNLAKTYRQAGIKGMGERTATPPAKNKIARENLPNFGIAENPRKDGESITEWIERLKAMKA
jgi:hypothetical protein